MRNCENNNKKEISHEEKWSVLSRKKGEMRKVWIPLVEYSNECLEHCIE